MFRWTSTRFAIFHFFRKCNKGVSSHLTCFTSDCRITVLKPHPALAEQRTPNMVKTSQQQSEWRVERLKVGIKLPYSAECMMMTRSIHVFKCKHGVEIKKPNVHMKWSTLPNMVLWEVEEHREASSRYVLLDVFPVWPTLLRGNTMKAPPPLASTIMATNLGLTEQKLLSHVIWEIRMSS